MNQILHILQKDIRRLRWEILGSVLLTLLLAWLNGDVRLNFPASREARTLQQIRGLLQPPVLLGWWLLILLAIQGDALPGIRQFWITRPYRRGALLGAKFLFIALFVHAPSFLGDVVTISRAGLPLDGQWGALLWKQVLLGAILLLPVMAIAAVTTTLAQAMLGALGLMLLNSLLAMIPGRNGHGYNIMLGLGWWGVFAHVAIALLAAVALFYWQYFRRATESSRVLILAANLAFVGVTAAWSWPVLYGWQTRLAAQPGAGASYSVRPALERGRRTAGRAMRPVPDRTTFALPVDVTTPSGLEPLHDGASIWFEGSNARAECWMSDNEAKSWIQCNLDRSAFMRVRGRPLTIRGTVYATIFGREKKATIPLYHGAQAVPHAGICGTADEDMNLYVWCQSVFPRRQWTRARLRDLSAAAQGKPGTLFGANYGPVHTDPGISPLTLGMFRFGLAGAADEWTPRNLDSTIAEITTLEPLDHVIRGVRFDNVRLEDYEVIAGR